MHEDICLQGLPGRRYQGVEYIRFDRLLMCDWDMPHPSHPCTPKGSCVTIPHQQYVVGILNRDVCRHKDHVWQLYRTPAGCRAFLVSQHRAMAHGALALMENLSCDPIYRQLAAKQDAWWCRVSPKVGRRDDYVARYWMTVRGVRGREDDDALRQLDIHDRLCDRLFEQRHLVLMRCRLCRLEEDVLGDGYVCLRRDMGCGLCHGKGHTYVDVGAASGDFLRALKANRTEPADMVEWSDLLLDTGVPEQVAENVRRLDPWDVSLVEIGHGTPRPIRGQFTDWSTAPSQPV